MVFEGLFLQNIYVHTCRAEKILCLTFIFFSKLRKKQETKREVIKFNDLGQAIFLNYKNFKSKNFIQFPQVCLNKHLQVYTL